MYIGLQSYVLGILKISPSTSGDIFPAALVVASYTLFVRKFKARSFFQNAYEYSDLPVRHNEDQINQELSKQLPLEVNQYTLDCSNTKTHLLLQAHFCQLPLPSSDYLTDTKSVMDQAIRILQVKYC